MNILCVKSIRQSTPIMSTYQQFKLKELNILDFKASYRFNKRVLQSYTFPILPFLLKVQFIKTIKSVTPQVTYQYIHPQYRLTKSLKYYKFIKKNTPKHTKLNVLDLYKSSLKI